MPGILAPPPAPSMARSSPPRPVAPAPPAKAPPRAIGPGASPLAAEAESLHPAGLAVARRLAAAPFSPLELNIAKDSVRQHGGAGAVLLHGAITGTAAFNLGRRLDALKAVGARAVIVDMNSEGGAYAAGMAMIRALGRFATDCGPTIAHVRGLAGSMASAVAVALDYGLADPFAGRFFVHEPSGGEPKLLAAASAALRGIYAARTLIDVGALEGYLAGAVTLDAQGAWTHGFIDEVAGQERVEEIARGAARGGGLYAPEILAANSWRQRVLRERRADAEGCVRLGAGGQ